MDKLYKSYRIRLEPNNVQLTAFRKHAGCARYAYNFAIEKAEIIYGEIGYSSTAIDLNKMFVRLEKEGKDWLYEVSKCCTQQAIRDYSDAIKRFHRAQKASNYSDKKATKRKDENGKQIWVLKGLPQRKKKGKSHDSFYCEWNGIDPLPKNSHAIKLPKIGWVRTSEELPQGLKIMNCVISRSADDWFISFRAEFAPTTHKNHGRVGVDLGIKKLATCSDGVCFESPKRYKDLDKKMKREQRKLARMYEDWKEKNGNKKGKNMLPKSNNFVKQQRKIAKLHKRISDHRKDAIHKATTHLTKNHTQVVIEDLAVSNMLKNGNLARSISNGGWYEFRRQLEYKAKFYGAEIIVADRFFPSSKMCHCCGYINKDLKLKDREWDCLNCGAHLLRDDNSSINLRNYPDGGYAASCAVKACGAGSSVRAQSAKRSPVKKQEMNTEFAP